MSGTTDIILMGAALIGGVLVLQNWPQIQAALQVQGGAPAAAAPAPAPQTVASATPIPTPPPVPTGSTISTSKVYNGPRNQKTGQPLCLQGDTACYNYYKTHPNINDVTVAQAYSYPGYYKGYNVPVMGPQWRYTVPYERRADDVPEKYSYKTVVDPQTGAKHVTIDPFFPSGFLNTQANYPGSLKDPAIRGS